MNCKNTSSVGLIRNFREQAITLRRKSGITRLESLDLINALSSLWVGRRPVGNSKPRSMSVTAVFWIEHGKTLRRECDEVPSARLLYSTTNSSNLASSLPGEKGSVEFEISPHPSVSHDD